MLPTLGAHARLHVSRLKSSIPSVHPLTGTELRALHRLQREQEPGRYLFLSERGAPMSAVGFRRMITKLGKAAKMPFSVHPHMLRHACGFKLANDGHDTVWLRRRRPGGTCPPQPQCAAINAQRLRRDLLGRDHIFEGVGVQRVEPFSVHLRLGVHEKAHSGARRAGQVDVVCEVVGEPIHLPGAE